MPNRRGVVLIVSRKHCADLSVWVQCVGVGILSTMPTTHALTAPNVPTPLRNGKVRQSAAFCA